MIINKEIQLELQRIDIQENPVNHKGNYACYQFAMSYPSEYYFFKKPENTIDKDFSVMWGRSPQITFYTKQYKDWRKLVEDKIKTDLPAGFNFVQHVTHWHLAIANYDKTQENRPWAIYYSAETYYNQERVKQSCERHIPVAADFMLIITSKLPLKEKTV